MFLMVVFPLIALYDGYRCVDYVNKQEWGNAAAYGLLCLMFIAFFCTQAIMMRLEER